MMTASPIQQHETSVMTMTKQPRVNNRRCPRKSPIASVIRAEASRSRVACPNSGRTTKIITSPNSAAPTTKPNATIGLTVFPTASNNYPMSATPKRSCSALIVIIQRKAQTLTIIIGNLMAARHIFRI
jgi:hypothetical protein